MKPWITTRDIRDAVRKWRQGFAADRSMRTGPYDHWPSRQGSLECRRAPGRWNTSRLRSANGRKRISDSMSQEFLQRLAVGPPFARDQESLPTRASLPRPRKDWRSRIPMLNYPVGVTAERPLRSLLSSCRDCSTQLGRTSTCTRRDGVDSSADGSKSVSIGRGHHVGPFDNLAFSW